MDRYSVDEFAMHYRQFDSIGHIASPVDNFDRHSKFFMNLVNLLEFVEEFWLSAFLQKCRVLFLFPHLLAKYRRSEYFTNFSKFSRIFSICRQTNDVAWENIKISDI